MNFLMRMLGQIVRKDGTAILLRLHRIYALNQYSTALLKPTIFVSSCNYTSAAETQSKHHGKQRNHQKYYEHTNTLSETYHHRRFFESSMYYADTTVNGIPPRLLVPDEQVQTFLNTNWDTASKNEILVGLKILSYIANTDYAKEIFTKILDIMQSNCHLYDDNTVIEMLKSLIYTSQNGFILPSDNKLAKCFDRECLKRFSKTSFSEMLQIVYIMHYIFPISQSFSFPRWTILRLSTKPQKLTPKNLVQLLYLISTVRKSPATMYDLEYRLEQCKEELSITELGIATLGFFKSRSTIKSSDLFNYIVDRGIEHAKNMDSITLSEIMKTIRYSLKLQSLIKIYKLMELIESRIEDVHIMTVTHISEAYVALNYYNENSLRCITERLKRDIKIARIKDIERICQYLCHFNYVQDKSVFNTIIAEITARLQECDTSDVETFSYSLPRILHYLANVDIYVHSLLKHVMSEQYINALCKGNYAKLDYCYYYLTCSVPIDDPSYDGPLIPPVGRALLRKKIENTIDYTAMHKPKQLLSDVILYCKKIVTVPNALYVGKFLPQYSLRDIFIGFDENMQLVPINSTLSCLPIDDLTNIYDHLPSHIRLIALAVASSQHKFRGADNQCPSHFLTKLKQLKRIGCIPRVVWFDKWDVLSTESEKTEYLQSLIFCKPESELIAQK